MSFTKFRSHIHFWSGEFEKILCPNISSLVLQVSSVFAAQTCAPPSHFLWEIRNTKDHWTTRKKTCSEEIRVASVQQSFRVLGDSFLEFTLDWWHEQVSSVLWGTRILKSLKWNLKPPQLFLQKNRIHHFFILLTFKLKDVHKPILKQMMHLSTHWRSFGSLMTNHNLTCRNSQV